MTITRREFLAASLGTLAAGSLSGCDDHGASSMPKVPEPSVGADGKRLIPWQNWSGYRYSIPQQRAAPATIDELTELLKNGTTPIRPVGAGHSFTELVPTD